MVNLIHLGLRASQLLWTLLCTALIGNVIASAFAGNPSSINYAIFACVISWLACLYGIATELKESFLLPIALLALDAVATLFTFIASVVLAAKLHVHSCSNLAYVRSNSLTNGSHNPTKRCRELQATTAFMWFLFASYVGSLAMDYLTHGTSSIGRGKIRKGFPSRSLV
ncbi:hypothetical protein K3495_g3657 [Podosphaera aphanis]|nr:hypothetical protein K3495_g3657 [Podosphaera aphanis]